MFTFPAVAIATMPRLHPRISCSGPGSLADDPAVAQVDDRHVFPAETACREPPGPRRLDEALRSYGEFPRERVESGRSSLTPLREMRVRAFSRTRIYDPTAVRPGFYFAVALAWLEFGLSPAPFTADTT